MTDRSEGAATDIPPADQQVELLRSEERLRVSTQRVPNRIARLEKYIVTEQRTFTVELRHEEVRLVYVDLPDDGATTEHPADSPQELPVIVLSEEQIQVQAVVVPVERVRVTLETVTEQRDVVESVRVERVSTEGDAPPQH